MCRRRTVDHEDAPRVRMFWSVAAGAALGGVARNYLNVLVQGRAGAAFPYGTLLINVTGSLLLGFIMRYALQTDVMSVDTRAFLTTGFCGGYTTFSTFSYETVMLMHDGEYARAISYVLVSVVIALAAVVLGFAAADRLIALRVRA